MVNKDADARLMCRIVNQEGLTQYYQILDRLKTLKGSKYLDESRSLFAAMQRYMDPSINKMYDKVVLNDEGRKVT